MSNIATVQNLYAAFGRQDVPAILEHLAEDVGWDLDAPGYGLAMLEPGTGKAHAARFFEALSAAEFLRFEPQNFLEGGNQVAVPLAITIRVKATGKVVEMLEVHLFTFGEDGKVSRFFHCLDRHALVLGFQD
jgi:ketosteroid isomerase-like protein